MLTRRPKSDTGSTGLPDCGDSIDQLTFEQILEMDDDEDEREFSKSIVYGFFEQAEQTFKNMDIALYVETSFISPVYFQLFHPQHTPNIASGQPPKAKAVSK